MIRARSLFSQVSASFVAVLVVVVSGGCQTLCMVKGPPVANEPEGEKTSRTSTKLASSVQPSVTVELYPQGRQRNCVELPLVGVKTVQQAVDQAGASKQFRKMKIDVIRTVDQSGHVAKMGVTYLPSKRQVAVTSDYALYPGDRIVVIEDTSSPLAEILAPLKPLVNPLGG